MDQLRAVSIDQLRLRLRDLLGAQSMIFERFDEALSRKDDARLSAAFDSLLLYPDSVRRGIEEAILAWLFGTTCPLEAAGPAGGTLH